MLFLTLRVFSEFPTIKIIQITWATCVNKPGIGKALDCDIKMADILKLQSVLNGLPGDVRGKATMEGGVSHRSGPFIQSASYRRLDDPISTHHIQLGSFVLSESNKRLEFDTWIQPDMVYN